MTGRNYAEPDHDELDKIELRTRNEQLEMSNAKLIAELGRIADALGVQPSMVEVLAKIKDLQETQVPRKLVVWQSTSVCIKSEYSSTPVGDIRELTTSGYFQTEEGAREYSKSVLRGSEHWAAGDPVPKTLTYFGDGKHMWGRPVKVRLFTTAEEAIKQNALDKLSDDERKILGL